MTRYILESDRAKYYINEVLGDGNVLSKMLAEKLSYGRCSFFALIDGNADLSRIYEFKAGWIVPPQPIEKITVLGQEYAARRCSSSEDSLTDLVEVYLTTGRCLTAIFEDIDRSPTSPHTDLFRSHGVQHQGQVYYVITLPECSHALIHGALNEADALWRFVCFLTEERVDLAVDRSLTLEKIEAICNKTTAVIAGAYDGEGYVTWEKSDSPTSSSCSP